MDEADGILAGGGGGGGGPAPKSRRLAAALRLDIILGAIRPGAVLPTIERLARERGASRKVARRALELLAAEGWTRPVRGVGSVVLERSDGAVSNGRVLIYARRTGYSYYSAGLMAVIDERLLAKGYKTVMLDASARKETAVFRRFEAMLREKWSLVALLGGGATARRLAVASGQPFMLLSDGASLPKCPAGTCVGRIGIGYGKALREFVCECVRRGIRRVVQFKYGTGGFDAGEALAGAGIAVETRRIRREAAPASVAQSALAEMRPLANVGRLPDLFLFTDDHVAQGALLALAAAGVRIPEDVAVATHANKGLGPVWTKPLSRLEVDPAANGRATADAMLRWLERGKPSPELVLESLWKRGRTM